MRPAELVGRVSGKPLSTAAQTDGRFVIDHMEVTPLPIPATVDDPKLPRVLIIGDSISMNY